MKWVKRIALGLVGLVVLVIGVPWGVGSLMPREHTGRGDALIAATPDEVWKTLIDFEAMSTWAPEVGQVERLPDVEGRRRFQEKRPDTTLLFTFVEVVPPQKLVVDLADDVGYFGGTWTYELAPEGSGTRLAITEQGWAGPGFFRFMIWLFGPDATLRQYLQALQAKFTA